MEHDAVDGEVRAVRDVHRFCVAGAAHSRRGVARSAERRVPVGVVRAPVEVDVGVRPGDVDVLELVVRTAEVVPAADVVAGGRDRDVLEVQPIPAGGEARERDGLARGGLHGDRPGERRVV
jgi:hypothetical protein